MSEQIVEVATEFLLGDPDRFQSRADYPRDARTSDLGDVLRYSPAAGGVLSVWQDRKNGRIYVVDGHRRLALAQRLNIEVVRVQFLNEESDSEAFACGVDLNLAAWAFEGGDNLTWALASRRGRVERALHSGWLDPDGVWAYRLYANYYPDLGRRYSGYPESVWVGKL